MSLFDILKYQNTDLDSYDALMALPEDLVILFWVKAYEYAYSKVPRRNNDKNKMCDALSSWRPGRIILRKELFNKALKDYSNDNL